MSKNKYDKMDYKEFVDHLKKSKIMFTEVEFIDYEHGEAVAVSPVNCTLKTRYFSEDGGCQIIY